ncbi:serine threonine phosphatase 2A activator 1 [Cladorrhinum samala]|uniref:Serine/threonine-protein phosphatase 2A activator n=1 Tax=Cladorrhinum samala TaxID=585594 RepID=A0AAV9HUJ8_9PEZI|nr:serine threonine phosphatase 2A activator 1 [Cladorrhinum samala]
MMTTAGGRHQFTVPVKKINTGADMQHFLVSKAYRDIVTFLHQLNRSVCPRYCADAAPAGGGGTTTKVRMFETDLSNSSAHPEGVERLRKLLLAVDLLSSEYPAEAYADRRFGNRAFRSFLGGLRDKAGWLLEEHLGLKSGKGKEELVVYLLGAWGSAERLDYGTGHELSFLAFLGGLWKLGFFYTGNGKEEEAERGLVLVIVELYLETVRKLILKYTLEPAGSHGVWGLDDHSFLPYIFGSAQLTRPIKDGEAMPLEGSAPGSPKPSEILNANSMKMWRGKNMYFSAIGFINDVKKGPFWEHSPTLYDISGIAFGWGKINKGMVKMYDAEVLGKFPVVQHFPFGSLFEWEAVPGARMPAQSVHVASQPTTTSASLPGLCTGAGRGEQTSWPLRQRLSGPAGGAGAATLAQARSVPISSATGAIQEPSGLGGQNPESQPRSREPPSGRRVSIPDLPFLEGKPSPPGAQYSVTRAPWAKDNDDNDG